MLQRLLNLPREQSFFLFGARGTGKSTLVQHDFDHQNCLWIDLLNPEQEDLFARQPNELVALVSALGAKQTHVIIDEVQKVPKLLSIVHSLIEKTDKKFILTGSSARKLKYGGADLLAGRAFVFHLFPFSYLELGAKFDLNIALRWGLLPKIYSLKTDEDRLHFLQAYTYTYLKEEVWAEHLVKNLDPFRRFLEVSAQCNGQIINYSNISRDVGVDDKTVKEYFSILEDTLLGFMLEPFEHSFRKRLSQKPKFYYFDTGVVRALARQLSIPLQQKTNLYGVVFEHFIIVECLKLASYYHPEFRFSYLRTKDDAEVDLIVERPGLPLLFIEIKSNDQVKQEDLSSFNTLITDFKDCQAICLSNDIHRKKYGSITVIPWHVGIKELFGKN